MNFFVHVGKKGKQRFTARKPRNIFRQQNLTSSKNMTKEMFHKLHRVNLLSLKERDYSDLDLDEWCAIQETLLREASHGEPSSADLVSQQAHLGPAVHDSSSDANFHNMWTSKTPITHSCLSDLIPVDEDFGLGDTMAEMLEKADHETLRDIMHVYYPAFKKNESLRVDYDAYYESEPDTLSCCSDPPTAEEEDRMERRAWTIQMPEIFEMLRANVGHLSGLKIRYCRFMDIIGHPDFFICNSFCFIFSNFSSVVFFFLLNFVVLVTV